MPAKIHPGLQRIHDLLFVDIDAKGEYVNPEKSWDAELIDMVAAVVCEFIPRPSCRRRISPDPRSCQCCDPGCPIHAPLSHCGNKGRRRLYRVDMEDRTGTRMCDECAEDAMKSGLFRTRNG